jgi:uncharacterized protein with NRDE domain
MCLLALCFRVVEDAPLVVGANREEAYVRGGEPPKLLLGPVPAVGGRDPVGGGTWLGVNALGLFVALTNRPKEQRRGPLRSRGLLVRDLLGCRSAHEAAERAAMSLTRDVYAGCNVVCADSDQLVVVMAGDWLRVRPLPPGIHVLATGDVNSPTDRRVGHALRWLRRRRFHNSDDIVAALKEVCSDPGDEGVPPICTHGPEWGTVSSSIVVLRQPLERSVYLHAQGPPDETPYEDCSPLLRSLVGS